MAAIIPKMSGIDKCLEMETIMGKQQAKSSKGDETDDHRSPWSASKKDLEYIIPTAKMILRTQSLSQQNHQPVPSNIYHTASAPLSLAYLDSHSEEAGTYLIKRFLVKEQLMGMTKEDVDLGAVSGPKELIAKLKTSKGCTIRRSSCKPPTAPSGHAAEEKHRQQTVKKQHKDIDGFSSKRNTCQAVLKPDCSKPDTNKASGVRNALLDLLSPGTRTKMDQIADLESRQLLYLDKDKLPGHVVVSATAAVVEFAGVKFKIMKADAGPGQYLRYIETSVIGKITTSLPHLRHLVIVEEKYSFTPDAMKAATRSKRSTSANTIGHLKDPSEIISSQKLDTKAITCTSTGKQAISTYLAENVHKLKLPGVTGTLKLHVDSELHTKKSCSQETCEECSAQKKFCAPLECMFTRQGHRSKTVVGNIHQRKGEAEMAQIDWLIELQSTLQPGNSVVCYVTSADIDSVVLHMFAVSRLWKRNPDGSFANPVFLVLQKQKKAIDVYNITGIIHNIENRCPGRYPAMVVAAVLSMAGNDFLPKMHGYTHSRVLQEVTKQRLWSSLVTFTTDDSGRLAGGMINKDQYLQLIKSLYCPPHCDPQQLSLEEVRQFSVRNPCKKKKGYNPPQQWMPPTEALMVIIGMANWHIQYMFTAGTHAAFLPDPCLTIFDEGVVGTTLKVDSREDMLTIPENILKASLEKARRVCTQKRERQVLNDTPEKSRRRKHQKASTPKKADGICDSSAAAGRHRKKLFD